MDLIPSSPEVSISYRLDDQDWQDYSQTLFLNKTTNIEAKGFKNNKEYGALKTTLFKTKSTFKLVNYLLPYHENYTANSTLTFTDGQIGSSTKFRDGNWQGFYGTDLEVIIDLQTQDSLNFISIGFFQYNLSWILLPKEVVLSISNDKYFLALSIISFKSAYSFDFSAKSFLSTSPADNSFSNNECLEINSSIVLRGIIIIFYQFQQLFFQLHLQLLI